jgi:hypothetical protein
LTVVDTFHSAMAYVNPLGRMYETCCSRNACPNLGWCNNTYRNIRPTIKLGYRSCVAIVKLCEHASNNKSPNFFLLWDVCGCGWFQDVVGLEDDDDDDEYENGNAFLLTAS